MAKSIPPKLEQEVVSKSLEGWSTRKISKWLQDAHGVSASFKTVARLLTKTKPERQAIAREVVREKLAGSVGLDVDRLERHAAQLDEVANGYFEAVKKGINFAIKGARGDIYVEGGESYAKVVDQLRKVTETKLAHAGLAGADKNGLPALQAEKLRAEIELLKKRAAEGIPPARPSLAEEEARLEALRERYPELRDLPGEDVHGQDA